MWGLMRDASSASGSALSTGNNPRVVSFGHFGRPNFRNAFFSPGFEKEGEKIIFLEHLPSAGCYAN